MELIFSTNNSNKFSTKLTPGQCMGMSCDWAKVSLSLKNVYKDALSPGKWDIGQSAYEFGITRTGQDRPQEVKIIQAFGMKVTNGGGSGLGYNIGNANDASNRLTALGNGTYIWIIIGHDPTDITGTKKLGHALGCKKTSTAIDLFDPNLGLLRTLPAAAAVINADFIQDLTDLLNTYYTDLLEELYIYQVALP